MARHSARVRRLRNKLRDQREDLRQARRGAISEEELEAEMIDLAVEHGYPGDPAKLSFEMASAWITHQTRAVLEALEAEQDRL